MLAFEVHLNGEKICTAGVGEPGVMTGIVTWVLHDGQGILPTGHQELDFSVGGLVSRTEQHLDWHKRSLRQGDEVSIRIVKAKNVDTPKKRKGETPAQRRRQQERYVRRMAKQLGWKIVTKMKPRPKQHRSPK